MPQPIERQKSSLLVPSKYDDDAQSIHSDQEADSSDDEVLKGARTSSEIRAHDRNVLEEEEERDRILSENRQRKSSFSVPTGLKKVFGNAYTSVPRRNDEIEMSEKGDGRRQRRRERRARKRERLMSEAEHGEDRELMYEMEEGTMKEGSSTGESSETEGSSDIDRKGLNHLALEKSHRRRRWRNFCFLHILIAVGFSILVLGAWRLSMGRVRPPVQKMFNNGTALFAPTTILISLDGFRADFLQRGLTPRLNAFIEEGISPPYMLPTFPTVTFPNHYTLVTGLYPESHGVVGNTFWDPIMKQEFWYTDPNRSMQGKWWGGEPLWVTAEKQGIRTAVHMWPGSEAHIMELEPSFLDSYNGREPLNKKVDRILQLLDMPGLEDENAMTGDMRPQLIAAYVPNVDTDGHLYGPNSTEIRTTISNVDKMLDQLFAGLEARNLTQCINVVVVSDHGMATTSTDRLIQLDDLVDLSQFSHIDGWPLYGLRPKDPNSLYPIYDKLLQAAELNPNFDVYLRDINMPKRYHFSNNQRIAPLWLVPKTGWAIVKKVDLNVEYAKAKGIEYHPRGLHGYDHEHPLMRSIFVARGPAFPHKPNSRMEVFQNIEVYNIICDSLNLQPNPNNGTLRLPLKPVGFHNSETKPTIPADPVLSSTSTVSSTKATLLADPTIDAGIISISPIEASSAADPNIVPPHLVGIDPVAGEDAESDDEGKDKDDSLWDYFLDRVEKLKNWFGDLINGKDKDPSS